MRRLTEKTVLRGLVTAWRLAAWPTRRSPDLVNATTDGVVRAPSEFSSTEGSVPSKMAIQEFVVPKSMPRILLIGLGGKFCVKTVVRTPKGKTRATGERAFV